MQDELTNPAPESTEMIEGAEVNETPEIDESGGQPEIDNGEPSEPIDETEEVEWTDGKKYVVPKALKGALMKDADYTQKTQAVAEQRRAVEEAANQIRQQAEFQRQHLTEYAKLQAVTDQIAEFEKVDWQAAAQNDPTATQQAFMQYQSLKDSRDKIASGLSQKEQSIAHEQQLARAKQLADGEAILKRDIADWSPEKGRILSQFAADTFGFTTQELSQVSDHRLVKLLNLAHIGQQTIDKAKKAGAPAPVQAKPSSAVISGKSPATQKDPSKMTDAEWYNWNQEKRRKR